MSSKNLFGAIDPGAAGAIVILDINGNVIEISRTPMIGKEHDKHAMFALLRKHRDNIVHFALEDVHAVQTAGSTGSFEFGRSKGLWEMALCALDITHTLIQPKEWQKYVYEGIKKQIKPTKRALKDGSFANKVDTKATSLIAAKRLFPTVNLLATEKSKVPHDGIVDALLIAEVCRRKFK